jgi:hypothetical protein
MVLVDYIGILFYMWQYFWPHISFIYRNLTGGKTHVSHPDIFISRYGYVMVISVLYGVRVMVFNATLNTISAISRRSVLLVEETGVSGENHRPVASHWQFYHIMFYWVHLAWAGFELTKLVVIGTDCIGSFKSNYHTITMAPCVLYVSWIYITST